MHICEKIYQIGANAKVYGDEKGVCRITGKESAGIDFNKWVRKTFNDYDFLHSGNIISNEALFCFDEASDIVRKKTGKEKPQRFRTYSHIVKNGVWHCLTKADKPKIFELITDGAETVCLAESGQKHILFKHKIGMWQIEETFVKPDIELLKRLHYNMCELLAWGFSQAEIITAQYYSARIMKAGLQNWLKHENEIKQYRGSLIFDFTSFMLFTNKNHLKEKQDKPKPAQKTGEVIQQKLWD